MIYEYETKLLRQEWDSLVWEDANKEDEDPRCENHLSDATLYAWRYCYNYLYKDPEPKYDHNSEQYMDEFWRQEDEELERELEEERSSF